MDDDQPTADLRSLFDELFKQLEAVRTNYDLRGPDPTTALRQMEPSQLRDAAFVMYRAMDTCVSRYHRASIGAMVAASTEDQLAALAGSRKTARSDKHEATELTDTQDTRTLQLAGAEGEVRMEEPQGGLPPIMEQSPLNTHGGVAPQGSPRSSKKKRDEKKAAAGSPSKSDAAGPAAADASKPPVDLSMELQSAVPAGGMGGLATFNESTAIQAQHSDADDSEAASDVSAADTKFSMGSSYNEDFMEGVNEYFILEELGRGAAGYVRRAMHQATNKEYAIKVVRRAALADAPVSDVEGAVTKFQREVAIMKRLKHRNIARLHEVIDDPDNGQLYLVLPLLCGPVLKFDGESKCPRLPPEKVRHYMRHIVAGLQYLQRHRIVHRDLKPDNVLLTADDMPVLVDFGISEHFTADNLSDSASTSASERSTPRVAGLMGTPMFVAPEIVRGEPPSFAGDIWALGVMCYCMLYGELPFHGKLRGAQHDADDLLHNICHSEPLYDESVDYLWNDLLQAMLLKDKEMRMPLADVKRHPAVGGAKSRAISGISSPDSCLSAMSGSTASIGDLELGAAVAPAQRSSAPAVQLMKCEADAKAGDAESAEAEPPVAGGGLRAVKAAKSRKYQLKRPD